MVTQLPHEGLTSVEQSLVEHVACGDWLDLAAEDEAVDEAAMRSWGKARTCDATVIREILRGRLAAGPDPHGLRLRGARITGRLDLENLTTDVNLELRDCLLEEGILARGARLAFVGLAGCRLEHPTEPPLAADRLTCSVLALTGATITGHTGAGAVRLRRGAVRLTGAHIGGSLEGDGANLRNDFAPALVADGLQVGQDVFLREGFTATGGGENGAVRLTGAHIGGSLLCDGANLRNDSGPALVAYGLQVGQSVFLRRGFTAIGAGERGAVRLVSGHIGGNLDCTRAELRNVCGPALVADVLRVDQDVECDGLTADGGVVLGGHIGRLLSLEGATLNNPGGIALSSDGLRVDGTMFCRNGFTAHGEVRLPGAQIGGRLYFDGAKLSNPGGHALVASRLNVGQDMFCRNRGGPEREQPFLAEGVVDLRGAHIGGHLDFTGANLSNDSGPALVADSLHVDQNMVLRDGFTATGGSEEVAVDLGGAQVGGTLVIDPAGLKHTADAHRRLKADGLTYTGVPSGSRPGGWLDLLRDGTPAYTAQPYQQLAAGYRALGDDRQARQTLMTQRNDQLARTHPRWPERWWGWITKITLGYGYKPWRALWFLAGVVALSCLLAVVLGAHGALAQTSKTATPGRSCTVVQQVSLGLDLNLPVGTSVARASCDLTKDSASATGAWLTALGWVLRVLAWVFAALFIAGFTSAVRKT